MASGTRLSRLSLKSKDVSESLLPQLTIGPGGPAGPGYPGGPGMPGGQTPVKLKVKFLVYPPLHFTDGSWPPWAVPAVELPLLQPVLVRRLFPVHRPCHPRQVVQEAPEGKCPC
jgi:hypothetical protein